MTLPQTVRDLPLASARFVWKTLEHEEPMTQKDLKQSTGYSQQTLHRALRTLEEHDRIRVEHSTEDNRQQVYYTH